MKERQWIELVYALLQYRLMVFKIHLFILYRISTSQGKGLSLLPSPICHFLVVLCSDLTCEVAFMCDHWLQYEGLVVSRNAKSGKQPALCIIK